jgi:hypothetical protein
VNERGYESIFNAGFSNSSVDINGRAASIGPCPCVYTPSNNNMLGRIDDRTSKWHICGSLFSYSRLSKHNLSLEDPTRLLSILQTIKEIGYEPKKIVARFSHIESLRQTEKGLKNNCKMLEKRAARYQYIIPLSEQFVSFGIGIDPLIAFNILVTETAETYNIPISGAAFRVIKEIEDYREVIGLKKELSRLSWQIFTMNEILGRKNNAVMALIKLQSHGVTEDQILYLNRHLEKNSTAATTTMQKIINM